MGIIVSAVICVAEGLELINFKIYKKMFEGVFDIYFLSLSFRLRIKDQPELSFSSFLAHHEASTLLHWFKSSADVL